jgi:hypothetical protein
VGAGLGPRRGDLDPHSGHGDRAVTLPGAPDRGPMPTWTPRSRRSASCGPQAGRPPKTPTAMRTLTWTAATTSPTACRTRWTGCDNARAGSGSLTPVRQRSGRRSPEPKPEVPVPLGDYLETLRQPGAPSRSTGQNQSVDMEAHARREPVPQRVVHDHIQPQPGGRPISVIMAACEQDLFPRRARADHPFGRAKRRLPRDCPETQNGGYRVPRRPRRCHRR